MPRPRGRPSEREFYLPDKYKLGNFCRWCGKFRGHELHKHLYCHAKQLNSLHGAAYWCLNPECSFFTTNDAISIKHAINSWDCRHFYRIKYKSASRWAEREGMEQTLLDSKVILRPSTTSPNTWILPDNKEAHIRNLFLRKDRGLSPCIPGAAASSSAQSPVSSSAPAPAPENNMTGNSQAAAQKRKNEAADDDHSESDSISDNEANSEEEEDEDDDKRSDEGLAFDRIIKAGFWRLDNYDFDSLGAPEENLQGIEAETVNSPAASTSAVVRVAICPIEGHDVDLKGVEGVMAHIIDELYEVEKARGSFGTLQGAHGMATPFVRASVERGIPMATMNFMLHVVTKEVRDWAEGELSHGTVAEESVRRLQKRLKCQSFSRERRSIREACQSYIGHVYELSFDVKEFQVNADPADSIFKVLLRDPIILAHDIVSSSNVLARGEKLHLAAVDGPLSHFCHGTRYKTMLTKVHNEVRRLKQGGEGVERALPWADVDPATVVVLPLAFFIGDTPVCKSGALTQCPIVMTVLWFDSHGFRRNNTKRIMGYIPSPPDVGSAPHKAAVLKRACRQAAQRAILDLVDAWQHVAFRKGGLIWRVADGRLVRAIPAPALFLGDNKEQNVLAGTMERTRCRMCSANVNTMLKGEAMPEGPMRDFFDLKQAYERLRREDRASRIAFQEKYGLQVDGSQGLFQTTVDFFAGKEVYRMFCFDTMHTLNLGPLKDILVATLSSVQTRKNKTCKFKTLKTLSTNMNGASSGLSQIQSDALADLQLYMHRAGNLPANALQRNRLEAKHILPLARATLTAFLHDLAIEAAEEQILPIARDLRVLLWALAAAVRVTHELTRPALDPGALPAAKQEVRELSRLVQRFRLLGGFKEMTTLKTHALSHMVDQIAFTGGTAFCDTASFEHYHLLVAKAARLDNNTDKTGSHMLHRAIELDAARILTPANPPDECKRARTIGEQGGVPHCAGIDVAKAASIIIKHIRNAQEQTSNLDALEEALRGKLEDTFKGAPAFDGFVRGKMGSIDLRVVGAKPIRWRAKPPTLFLTRDKSFFAPLLFLRSVSVPDTAESFQSKFLVAGAVVGRDEVLHARLKKTTYASNPLSGFAVVDLGDSLIHLRPDQLQIKSIDDLAAGDTIWLKPPSEEKMHRKIVFWPVGSSAFPSWLSCPFTDRRGDQAASAGDLDDVNDDEDFAILAHARETSRKRTCPASSDHQAHAQKMPRHPAGAQQTSQVSQALFSKD